MVCVCFSCSIYCVFTAGLKEVLCKSVKTVSINCVWRLGFFGVELGGGGGIVLRISHFRVCVLLVLASIPANILCSN